VFASAYSELFMRVPWHPALGEVHRGPNTDVVAAKSQIWSPLIGPRPVSVLEIGFGSGELMVALANLGYKCTGLDVEVTRVKALARLSIDDLCVMQGDGTRPNLNGEKFDVVVSQQLFEHLHPDDASNHLRAVRDLLHPGGRYFLETPNKHFGPHDVSRFFVDGRAQGFHLKEYSIAEMVPLFREAGFCRVYVVVWKKHQLSIWRARLTERLYLLLPKHMRIHRTLGLHNPIYVATA